MATKRRAGAPCWLTLDPGAVHVRWMDRRDLPAVLAIERAGFAHPWSEEDFLTCLRQRTCIGHVGVIGERVVGHVLYELSADSIELLTFAVARTHRRWGVGTQLADWLKRKRVSHQRPAITLAVGETNLPAQLFWRAMGFRATEVLRGHFETTGEDAYRMEYRA